jgi:hypothetical protein
VDYCQDTDEWTACLRLTAESCRSVRGKRPPPITSSMFRFPEVLRIMPAAFRLGVPAAAAGWIPFRLLTTS